MKIELYSYKRKAIDSKKLRIRNAERVHWLIVFPEYKKSYCSQCLYEGCLHGQSFINENVGSIFMENFDFKKRHIFDIEASEDKAYNIGMVLMTYFAQNPNIRKQRIENIIKKELV
jgi:hypothetical protein